MENEMKKLLRDGLLIVAIISLFFYLLWQAVGCRTVKSSVKTSDSIVLRIKDSIVTHNVVHKKDSTVIKDTLIRVNYDRAQYAFDFGDTKDTVVRSGRATLRKNVNNGVVTVQADCDSFDILVQDQRIIIGQERQEIENLDMQLSDLKKIYSSNTVSVKEPSGIVRFFGRVRNVFAWVGLLAIAYIIFKVLRRVYVPR